MGSKFVMTALEAIWINSCVAVLYRYQDTGKCTSVHVRTLPVQLYALPAGPIATPFILLVWSTILITGSGQLQTVQTWFHTQYLLLASMIPSVLKFFLVVVLLRTSFGRSLTPPQLSLYFVPRDFIIVTCSSAECTTVQLKVPPGSLA